MNCITTKDESFEAVRESYTLETKRVALFDKLTHTILLLNKKINKIIYRNKKDSNKSLK